jgi:hypothetical protein
LNHETNLSEQKHETASDAIQRSPYKTLDCTTLLSPTLLVNGTLHYVGDAVNNDAIFLKGFCCADELWSIQATMLVFGIFQFALLYLIVVYRAPWIIEATLD